MTVRQVIELAKSSEANGLPAATRDSSILGFINLGLLELYKRFTLRVEEWVITLEDNVSYYTAPNGFMWIVAAYGEVSEDSVEEVNILPVNEEDNPLSINTVGWNKVQIPLSVTGAFVSVIYAATPEKWYTELDMDIELDMPPQMIDALLAYIGWKANSSISAEGQGEGNVWYQRFEASCNNILVKGFANNNDMFMNHRINMRGFV